MRTYVLNAALTATIDMLPKLGSMGGEIKPYDLYVRAIDENLISPLVRSVSTSTYFILVFQTHSNTGT